jgi:hypothetical protein
MNKLDINASAKSNESDPRKVIGKAFEKNHGLF